MQFVNAVIFSAPWIPTKSYLQSLPFSLPARVYHGPTHFMPHQHDPYSPSKDLGIFKEITSHDFSHVNAGEIVERILKSRALFEERQAKKGIKNAGEQAIRLREAMEEEARKKLESI